MSGAANPAIAALHAGLRAGGADFVAYLPDSVLAKAYAPIAADPAIQTVICAREDEGIAICAGAWLAGKLPVAIMEGSGVGYAGLILARAAYTRIPMLILASHLRTLGEPYEYHAAGGLAAEAVFKGLNLPHLAIDDPARIRATVEQALVTVKGQKSVVGLIFASHIFDGAAA